MPTIRQLIAGSVLAAGLTVGGGTLLAGVASAHDFTPTANTPVCTTINGEVDKVATITVTNQFDKDATFTSTSLSGTRIDLPTSSPATYAIRRAGDKVGDTTDSITAIWPDDDFHQTHVVTVRWGDAPCPPPVTVPPTSPDTTVPDTTPTTAPPPDTTVPAPTTTAPATPTTTCAATVLLEDGTLVCPGFGAPPAPTTVVKAPRPTELPTTGSSSILAVGGLVVLVIGGVLLAAGRRGGQV